MIRWILGALMWTSWGCNKADPRAAKASESKAPETPQRTADADVATAGTLFDIDERTGRAKAVLVLRLDYFPAPRPGVTNLPVCYAPFPEAFEVGVAVCEGKPDVRVAVLAKNLDQDCYTDPSVERVSALQPLVMPGCKRGSVIPHVFEPRLRVDLEVRDVP